MTLTETLTISVDTTAMMGIMFASMSSAIFPAMVVPSIRE